MNYKWDRISYTDKTICDAGCKLPLTSGIAHVIINEHGEELHCGVVCSTKRAGNKPKGLPNVTLSPESNSSPNSSGNTNSSDSTYNSFTDKKKLALEYLHLRYRFNDHYKLNWSKVNGWYDTRDNLDYKDIYFLYNTRQKYISDPIQSALFLKKVWALQNKITRYSNTHPNEKKFLSGFVTSLGKKLSLSIKRKEILLQKFDGIDLDFLPTYDPNYQEN